MFIAKVADSPSSSQSGVEQRKGSMASQTFYKGWGLSPLLLSDRHKEKNVTKLSYIIVMVMTCSGKFLALLIDAPKLAVQLKRAVRPIYKNKVFQFKISLCMVDYTVLHGICEYQLPLTVPPPNIKYLPI